MNAIVRHEPETESATILSIISRAASDPNVDTVKMRELLDIRERVLAKQAEREYAEAMRDVQARVPKIAKDRHNEQTKSDYATLEAINEKLVPIYTAGGFSISFGMEDSPKEHHIRVIADVMHVGGHTRRYHYDSPIDDAGIAGKVNKTPTHASGSAMTYGRRYLTTLIFNLTSGQDDDGNGATGLDEGTEANVLRDWISALESAVDVPDLKRLKAELLKAYNDAPPAQAIATYNAMLKKLK